MRQRGLGACLALLSVVAGACASAQRPSPLIQGRGPVILAISGKPLKPGADEGQPHRRPLASANRRSASGFSATIEATDPRLGAALAALALAETPANHAAVALAYRQAGIHDAAYDHLKAALRADPSFAPAYDGLARIWRDWGFAPYGLGYAHRAVHHAPGSAAAWNTLGTLLEAVGDPLAAHAAYAQAVRLDPAASWAAENLARLTRQVESTAPRVEESAGGR